MRPSWASYYRSTDAVIVVLDSTDRARVRIAKVGFVTAHVPERTQTYMHACRCPAFLMATYKHPSCGTRRSPAAIVLKGRLAVALSM